MLDIHVHLVHIARMTSLAAYMKKAGLTDEALAHQVGRDRSTITKLRLGQTRPSLDLAIKIAEITDSEVPPTAYTTQSKAKGRA